MRAAATSGVSGPSATSPGSSPAGPTGPATCPISRACSTSPRRARSSSGGPEWQAARRQPAYFIVFSLARPRACRRAQCARPGGGQMAAQSGSRWTLGSRTLFCWSLGLSRLATGSARRRLHRESSGPSTRLKDIIFWSTIAFSLSGLESASMMGEEIRNARRNIPRASASGRGARSRRSTSSAPWRCWWRCPRRRF